MEITSYNPNKRQSEFHNSPARYRCYLGAVRAGKTKAGVWEGIDLSMKYPGNVGLISRKTYRELKDTTERSFFQECPERMIKDYKKSEDRVILINSSEIFFRSLDSIDKIKSLELGWWFLDEVTEIEEEYARMLESRLSLKKVPEHRGWVCTNPPNIDHWLYRDYVLRKDSNYQLIKANTYDNRENLPPGYIENLEKSYDPLWVRKYLEGEFGYDLKGKAVYYGFKSNIHRAKLSAVSGRTIVRGWDFGFHHPCVVMGQVDLDGRLNILKCVMGTDIYIQDFAPVILNLSNTWFSGFDFKDYGDPAGSFKKDTSFNTIKILKDQFHVDVEYSNSKIKPGVDLINQKMNTLIGGKPAIMVNDDETTNVIAEILQGAYYYKANEEEPYKDGYYEHPADALRYLVINLFGNKPGRNFNVKIGGPTYQSRLVNV